MKKELSNENVFYSSNVFNETHFLKVNCFRKDD